MKIIVLFAFIVNITVATANAQISKPYEIQVSIIDGIPQGKAFFRYYTDRGMFLDSVKYTNGKFSFTGNTPNKLIEAKLYVLVGKETEAAFQNNCEVWLEPGKIEISAWKELRNARYSGSEIQRQFTELQTMLLPVKKKNYELNTRYENLDPKKDNAAREKLLNEEYPNLFIEKQKILGAFIQKYPSSLISAFVFEDFAGEGQMNLAIVEPVYNTLSSEIRSNSHVVGVAERMAICKKTAPGMDALNFSQADTSGRLISLSSLRGNCVLIDFWAAWCMPCRAENPHLLKLYSKYHTKGFEILGVSLDSERQSWIDAIITDKLIWKQVSDLKVFDNTVVKQYGINSIPQSILIDRNGKIIAWNLRGDPLEKKLEELFK